MIFILCPNKLLILLDIQLTVSRLLPQLNSIFSPFRKISLSHFTFHETSIVLLIASVVNLPDWIVLEFLLEVVTHSMVAAGLRWVTTYKTFAEVRERCIFHYEPATAVLAAHWHELFFDALEQFKIEKGSQRCETISLTEYGAFFRINNVSANHPQPFTA